MKIKKILLLVVILAVLVGGSLFMIDLIKANKKFPMPLDRFSYLSSGGMTGGFTSKEVKKADDKVIVIIREAMWHSSYPISREYEADQELLKEIEDIFYGHKMANYNNLKNSPIFAYDAPTSSYCFNFGDEQVFFTSNKHIPPKGGEAISLILSLINEYSNTHKPLPSLDLSQLSTEEIEMGTLLEGGVRYMKIYDYCDKTLSYYINNGLADYEFTDSYELYYEGELLYANDEGEKQRVLENCSETFEIALPDYLKAGNYLLKIADLEVEFSLR